MLTVRNSQMEMLSGARSASFIDQLFDMLWRDWSPLCPGLGKDDLRALLDFSTRTCAEHGLGRQGAIIDFAQSMLKDDPHPMTGDRMTQKAEAILRDMRTGAMFERLQAAHAHRPHPSAEPSGDAKPQE